MKWSEVLKHFLLFMLQVSRVYCPFLKEAKSIIQLDVIEDASCEIPAVKNGAFFLELVHSIFPPLSLCELFTFYEGWRDAIFWLLLQGEAFFMFKKHTKCIVTPGGQYLKMRVYSDCGIWCKNPEKMDEGRSRLRGEPTRISAVAPPSQFNVFFGYETIYQA